MHFFFITGHCTLARNLTTQQKYFEVLQATEGALACAVPEVMHSWMNDSLVDCIRCGLEACDKTSQPAKRAEFLATVTKKYPELASKISAVGEAQRLWERGKAFMHTHNKNWVEGQGIFLRLVELEPNAFWAHLQAGICFTYGPEHTVVQGEAFAKRAIEIHPSNALGHALLVKNLTVQRRWQESLLATERLLQANDVGNEHELFILESCRAVRDTCRNLRMDGKFLHELLPRFMQRFPYHAQKLEGVPREPSCCIQ